MSEPKSDNQHEKSPMQSKKFVAYLISEISWKMVLFASLLTIRADLSEASAWAWWFMVIVVIVAGFMEAVFIGGQAYVDKYIRLAQIASTIKPTVQIHKDGGDNG